MGGAVGDRWYGVKKGVISYNGILNVNMQLSIGYDAHLEAKL